MTTTRRRVMWYGLDRGWSVQGIDSDRWTFTRGGARIVVHFIGADTFRIARWYAGGEIAELSTIPGLMAAMDQ
jgi:hypothetical protein